MSKKKLFKTWRLILPFLFIFFLIHLLKDITQDIFKISSFLDIFGDVKEDLSALPRELQRLFHFLGISSLFTEAFLLITIPIILKRKQASRLELIVVIAAILLLLFFAWATLLDPRYPLPNLIRF